MTEKKNHTILHKVSGEVKQNCPVLIKKQDINAIIYIPYPNEQEKSGQPRA